MAALRKRDMSLFNSPLKNKAIIQGDSHRFGEAVERVQENGENWFEKPRSIRLEKLFLDKHYQLNEFKNILGYSAPGFFNECGSWKGKVASFEDLAVTSSFDKNSSDSFAQNSGKLISIATLLGIVDLHYENILIANIDNQVVPLPVDLEIAFWNCVSGMDTLLYPSKLVEPNKAGLAAKNQDIYRPQNPEILLDSFLKTSFEVMPNLYDLFLLIENNLQGHPIRIILRPTAVYRQMLVVLSEISENKKLSFEFVNDIFREKHLLKDGSLLSEEMIQLLAGDIPYFFYYREKNPRMYYFSGSKKIDFCDPCNFMPVFTSASMSINQLCSFERIQKMLIVTSLQICKQFFNFQTECNFEGSNFKLNYHDNKIKLYTSKFNVITK